MPEFLITEDDLTGAAIANLLQLHFDDLRSLSPEDSCHVMTIDRLRAPDVTFWSAWSGNELAACGALKQLDPTHGEIKSMRAAPGWRGKGAGRAILMHLIAEARQRGYSRISLETGSPPAFEPARSLYARHGFTQCGPFGDYSLDPWSVYMTLVL